MQYPDLKLKFDNDLGWAHGSRAIKPLLSTESLHAKSVKEAMMKTLLINSLRRPREHEVAWHLRDTYEQLRGASFTQEGMISAMQKIAGENGRHDTRSHNGN